MTRQLQAEAEVFGQRLREVRQSRNVTQDALAPGCNVEDLLEPQEGMTAGGKLGVGEVGAAGPAAFPSG